MKLQLLTLAIAVSLLVLTVKADDKPKKHKKFHRHHNKKHAEDLKASEELMQSDDSEMMQSDQAAFSDAEAKLHAAELEREVERAKEKLRGDQEKEEENNNVFLFDPCTRVHCGAGRICKLSDDNEAECVCIETCPEESNPRRKTCSNHNETWGSDCAIYQHRCWCDSGDERCRGEQYRHVHIEYYGECRDMPKCTDEEMSDFPRRMRDWLFNIMRDLADRQELKPHYLQLEREAETNLTRRWANAAIWKWCDLDGHPHDRSISRHELFPIRAPLMALEHCIAPFLNNCDTDDDHRITLKEWGKCLEIEEEEIEDKCEELDNDDS